jgi:exosortase/archaeosortase family protein
MPENIKNDMIVSLARFIKDLPVLFKKNTIYGKLTRLAIFVLIYYLVRTLLYKAEDTNNIFSVFKPAYDFLSVSIIKICSLLLSPFYPDLFSNSTNTVYIANRPLIYLAPGCTAFIPMVALTVSLFLYPIEFKTKCFLWILSILVLFWAAVIHFLILIPVSYHKPEFFTFFHKWFTRVMFYGIYIYCWILWEKFREKSFLKTPTSIV